jgi:hypothetical protein
MGHDPGAGGGGKVWVREEISKRILGAHNTSALGCPSFALLDKKLPEISRSLYPKRILLTGDASKHYNFIFPVEAFPKAEFFYIPQSSNDVARALDGRGLKVLRPTSFDNWKSLIRTIDPDLVVGTRLHGTFIALSLGFNSALISGDLRSKGLSKLGKFPHFKDFGSFNLDQLQRKLSLYNRSLWKVRYRVRRQRAWLRQAIK